MMAGDVTPYTGLITSEHADKPNFMAMVAQTCQPFADIVAILESMPALYDVDTAVGEQLDAVGMWVGVTRAVTVPLTGVYFSFDTSGVGFDQGIWQGPYDPDSGPTQLPDDIYRIVLKARILNNFWDGSKSSAYTLANVLFNSLGYAFFIQDHGDLTMDLGLVGVNPPSAIIIALLTQGVFDIRPATILINNYHTATGRMFALDVESSIFGGFDQGNWATYF